MKAAVNGVLNVSVLDGWWCEGYSEETVDAVAFFGGCERKICSTNFRYGHATAMFGGVVLDFSNAKLAGAEATVNIFTMFGGTELKTVYIGSLRGTSIPCFTAPVAGLPMVHWAETQSVRNLV